MIWKKSFSFIVIVCLIFSSSFVVHSEKKKTEKEDKLALNAKTACLMEASTGKILFEKNKDQKMAPASVTKVMTLLLIFEALDSGKIHYEDTVSVSEHAASMGGSQVFLEPGETQSVKDMIKCIVISSANDACVAMAEKLEGSEIAFVKRMNQRAKELGMNNTTFKNCCGLDKKGHVTTAFDIGLMSRELITKHKKILSFTKIWMDQITHKTKKGSRNLDYRIPIN